MAMKQQHNDNVMALCRAMGGGAITRPTRSYCEAEARIVDLGMVMDSHVTAT